MFRRQEIAAARRSSFTAVQVGLAALTASLSAVVVALSWAAFTGLAVPMSGLREAIFCGAFAAFAQLLAWGYVFKPRLPAQSADC